MPYYHKLGEIPHKRHTQFRKPDGGLYREEVMGLEGFSSIEFDPVPSLPAAARQASGRSGLGRVRLRGFRSDPAPGFCNRWCPDRWRSG